MICYAMLCHAMLEGAVGYSVSLTFLTLTLAAPITAGNLHADTESALYRLLI